MCLCSTRLTYHYCLTFGPLFFLSLICFGHLYDPAAFPGFFQSYLCMLIDTLFCFCLIHVFAFASSVIVFVLSLMLSVTAAIDSFIIDILEYTCHGISFI
ncbi:hypothetical protein BDV06DRAFT_165480 [Aspergillus oleicola]